MEFSRQEYWSGLLFPPPEDLPDPGTEYNTSPFEGGAHYIHYPYQSLASSQTKGREHNPTHQEKIGLKIKDLLSPDHQNKTQFPPQSVSPIRKLP